MKKKSLIIYIAMFLVVAGNVISKNINTYDEIWIYNFARCMLEGMLPYKDFSIIITPLFPMVCSVFLRIFGNEMIVLRILRNV